MKKISLLLLALILAACAAPSAPTQQAAPAVTEPTATPVVVVQTVVVAATQAPTDVPPPTAVPPTAAPVVVTVVVQPTQDTSAQQQPAATAASAPTDGSVKIDDTLGMGVFTNMTMSSDHFTLRCSPRDVTFKITTPNVDIKDVMFYYRVVDQKRQYPSEWKAFGKMTGDGNGNFALTFKGEDVSASLRIDNSFIDFEFIGLSKSGDRVSGGGSDKIQSLLKYTFDCP